LVVEFKGPLKVTPNVTNLIVYRQVELVGAVFRFIPEPTYVYNDIFPFIAKSQIGLASFLGIG